jgi:sulfur-carrier protein
MPKVILTGPICQQAGGVTSIEVGGDTVAAAIMALEEAYPSLRGWVVDEQGTLRRHVRVFLRRGAIPLDEPVGPHDELHIVAAISGG